MSNENSLRRGPLVAILAVFLAAAVGLGWVENSIAPTTGSAAGRIIGNGVALFVLSGLLPVIAWAMMRFRADRAATILLVWFVLGAGTGYLSFVGTSIDRPAQAQTGGSGFTASARTNCEINQRKDPRVAQMGIGEKRIVAYCACFADVATATVTDEEVRYGEANGKMAPSFAAKQAGIRELCLGKTQGL